MAAEDKRKKGGDDEEQNSSDEEGIDVMNSDADSSEEEEDDPEEEARIREGFIEDDDEERERRRQKKKKRKHKEREFEELSEDDLELVEQNTGVRIERPDVRKQKKLKRAGANNDEGMDEDISRDEMEDLGLFDERRDRDRRRGQDSNLLNKAARAMDDMEEDDMADFIEEDSPDEGEERETDKSERRRKEKAARRRKVASFAAGGLDITAEAWDEIQEVFGDGHDYDDALESEDEDAKPQPTMRDVFEPSEIAERMMTDADEIIRAQDIPERMQIAQAGINPRVVPGTEGENEEYSDLLLELNELGDATRWVASRISDKLTAEYLLPVNGDAPPLHGEFLDAVQRMLNFLCVEYFEVPFIWIHRRDWFIHYDANALRASDRSRPFFTKDELWKIYSLAIKYRAMLDKKSSLSKLWQKLQVQDEYFEEAYRSVDSLEQVADLVEYVSVKYSKRLRDLVRAAGGDMASDDAQADAVRQTAAGTKYKRATTQSLYDKARDSMVADFAKLICVPAEQLVQNFVTARKNHFLQDPPMSPEDLADQYVNPDSTFIDNRTVIQAAQHIHIHELSKEPVLRKEIRKAFQGYGAVSVKPTDKGSAKIDETHPYYAFKYLLDKPISAFENSPQFLQVLDAEAEGLVEVDIHIVKGSLANLTQELYKACLSDSDSGYSRAWNTVREEIIRDALTDHLLPLGARWTREQLKEDTENWVASKCAAKLEERIEAAPYQPRNKAKGEVARVLAISHGFGDPKKDFVHTILLDSSGTIKAHERFEDLKLADTKTALRTHIERAKPDVIVIGGFSARTHALRLQVHMALNPDTAGEADEIKARENPDIVYVYDETATLFHNSKRAIQEFADLTPVARYCIGLARYVQSPLCEYAALQDDIASISYDPNQRFVPKDKLLTMLQRAIVNVTNIVGVDINRAKHDKNDYYRHLLQYVAGLGPRKAAGMLSRIQTICEGTLNLRADLVKRDICTSRVFMNCVAFLRIPPDGREDDENYDILDSTRIHSEDYHIARKMAADAEELDEEDLEDMHPSGAVTQLMTNGAAKLNELSLDDFATALYEANGIKKRVTLYMIRDELQRPFAEHRHDFKLPSDIEAFRMITGESPATLDLGYIVTVTLTGFNKRDGIWYCRLDSGTEGQIEAGYIDADVEYRPGQTIRAQVIGIDPSLDKFAVSLSATAQSVQESDLARRQVQRDKFYDHVTAEMDRASREAKTQRAQGRQRRVVNHPNFFNFNAGQAEQHLANMQRGDCVVRPSSRGTDHLAVTWKVDEGVYQHIDVLELDKPNEFSLGRQLRIQGKYTYSDLDELIVFHVRAMARKVEEMMRHEKYKSSEAELRKWLNTSIMAEPTRSFYGFALDPRKPGNFILSFLTKGYDIQTWSVTVEPNAFVLQGNSDPAPNVLMLCNAFKSTYVTKMALAGGNAGLAARTPYIQGRTPNPYGGGNMTPYGQAPKSPYARNGQQPQQQPYVHPSRMAQAGFGGGR